MTIGKLSITVFLVLLAALAFYVWPTPYSETQRTGPDGEVQMMRSNRWTNSIEVQNAAGEWETYREAPEGYDPVEAVIEDGVHKVDQARKDMQKMHDVTQDAINNGTTGK